MRRLIAGCLVAVMVSGCAQKAAFEDLADGPCSSAQATLVDQHISGQINALATQDWRLAYSFASPDFQKNVSVDEFIFIIGAQYSMLVENQGYKFGKCTVGGSKIAQEISVTSGEQDFYLTYSLSVNDSALGVDSAVLSGADSGLNT
jgi:hypothetical protein